MADYKAWEGLGDAIAGGGDAYMRAKAAKAAREDAARQAARQDEQDSMTRQKFQTESLDSFPQYEAPKQLGLPPGFKLNRGEVLSSSQKLAEIQAKREADMAARKAAAGEKAEAKKIAKRPGEVTVRNLSEGKLLPGELSNVEKLLADNQALFGPVTGRVGGLNPYDEPSQKVNSQIKATAQMIGKYMEGGVLRAEDIPKYAAMLPALSDTPEVAQGKINNIRSLLERKYNTDLESLTQGGYDVSEFSPLKMQQPQTQGGGEELPTGTVQDGYKFLGGDPADPKSWQQVQ